MYPTILKIGPLVIHSYGLMMALAFLICVYLISRDAPKWGLDPNFASDTALMTLVAGLIGTRVLYVIMFPENFSWNKPLGWIAIWQGGLVFQGAIPPAIAVIWWRLRKRGLPFWKTLDMAAPYVALGHAIGRIGCFLNGCCYGEPTKMPWGIRFPRVPFDTTVPAEGSPVFLDHCSRFGLSYSTDQWSLPVHPTQLYSAGLLLLLFGTLLWVRNRCRPFDGGVIILYFILYCIGRFIVEIYRGDHNPTHVLNMSDQQVFCVGGLVFSIILYIVVRNYQKHRLPKTEP